MSTTPNNNASPTSGSELTRAAINGDLERTKQMLEKKEATYEEWHEAFHLSIKHGHLEIVKLLIKKEKIKTDLPKLKPFMFAASRGQTEMMKFLLSELPERVVSKTCQGGDVYAALGSAIFLGHTDIVKLLLDRANADPNADILKSSPLYVAASNGYTEIMKILLAAGAKANAEPNALVAAAHGGHVGAINLLLTVPGIKTNARLRTKVGDTPLVAAVKNGHVDAVKCMLDSGRMSSEITESLQVAVETNNEEIRRLLTEAEKSVTKLAMGCCWL